LRLHAKYPGTTKLIVVEKQSQLQKRNEDGCASTAKLHAMAGSRHCRI
jgi:hypothetical protein